MMPRIILIGALTIAAMLAAYGDLPDPIGAPLVLAFLTSVPGLSWISRTNRLNLMEVCVVSVGLSLALDTVIGTLLAFGLWSPRAGFAALVAATAVGLLCTWRQDRRGEKLGEEAELV
jgi:hypothetical protein